MTDDLHNDYAVAVATAQPRPAVSPAAALQAPFAATTADEVDLDEPVERLDSGFGWPTTREAWLDVAERAAWNGGQAAGPLVLGLFGVGGVATAWTAHSWAVIAVLFASAAILSLAKNVIAWAAGVSPKKFGWDTAIGVGTAFAGALAGYIAAAHPFDLLTFDWPTTLRLSAGAAILSLTKMSVWPAVKAAIKVNNVRAVAAGPRPRKSDKGRHEAST